MPPGGARGQQGPPGAARGRQAAARRHQGGTRGCQGPPGAAGAPRSTQRHPASREEPPGNARKRQGAQNAHLYALETNIPPKWFLCFTQVGYMGGLKTIAKQATKDKDISCNSACPTT